MLLAAMILVALPALPAPAPGLRDGVFIGTFLSADGASLVVNADNGDVVTLVLDSKSDLPAGFVAGTRVAVRFQALDNRRYRVVSVSPPRIPPDAGALNTLPSWPEPEPEPAAPREQEPAAPVSSSESRSAPAGEPTFVAAVGGSAPTQAPSTPSAVRPLPSRPKPWLAMTTKTIGGSPSADGRRAGWLGPALVVLVTAAILAWRVQSGS
jgi:hypothetical protein